MQCFRRCALFLVVLGAALALAAGTLAWTASDWLARSDAAEPADAIVVLGHEPVRALEAVALYREKMAPLVLLSVPRRGERVRQMEANGIDWPHFEVASRRILERQGVPPEAIRTFGTDLISTLAEAEEIAAIRPPLKRVLVVSSPYHVYRARLIFQDALPGVDVRMIGNRFETLPRDWWRDQQWAVPVTSEFIKLPFYLVGGRMKTPAAVQPAPAAG